MSRKDFVMIAKVFNEQRDGRNDEHDKVINSLAYAMASELRYTNPRFNSQRFLIACGCPSV